MTPSVSTYVVCDIREICGGAKCAVRLRRRVSVIVSRFVDRRYNVRSFLQSIQGHNRPPSGTTVAFRAIISTVYGLTPTYFPRLVWNIVISRAIATFGRAHTWTRHWSDNDRFNRRQGTIVRKTMRCVIPDRSNERKREREREFHCSIIASERKVRDTCS